MKPISIDFPTFEIYAEELLICLQIFTCAVLILVAAKVKKRILTPPPQSMDPENLIKLIGEAMKRNQDRMEKELVETLFSNEKEKKEVRPLTASAAMEFERESVQRASKKYEGDPTKDKGGYLTPSFISSGPQAQPTHRKEYEAYNPANDPVRIMEGKEESQFSR